jgi:hypothetical protein
MDKKLCDGHPSRGVCTGVSVTGTHQRSTVLLGSSGRRIGFCIVVERELIHERSKRFTNWIHTVSGVCALVFGVCVFVQACVPHLLSYSIWLSLFVDSCFSDRKSPPPTNNSQGEILVDLNLRMHWDLSLNELGITQQTQKETLKPSKSLRMNSKKNEPLWRLRIAPT